MCRFTFKWLRLVRFLEVDCITWYLTFFKGFPSIRICGALIILLTPTFSHSACFLLQVFFLIPIVNLWPHLYKIKDKPWMHWKNKSIWLNHFMKKKENCQNCVSRVHTAIPDEHWLVLSFISIEVSIFLSNFNVNFSIKISLDQSSAWYVL